MCIVVTHSPIPHRLGEKYPVRRMTVADFKPTLFGPAKPRHVDDKQKNQREAWHALFLPASESVSSLSLSDSIISKRRPIRMKQRAGIQRQSAAGHNRINHSTRTLYDYLRQHFWQQPVSIYTEAGRIQGRVVDVSMENVTLATPDGTRAIDLHAIFSVAHQLPSR